MEFIKRSSEDGCFIILEYSLFALEEAVVSKHEQNRSVNILSQEDLYRCLLETIYSILGSSQARKPIEHNMTDKVHEAKPESKNQCGILLHVIHPIPILTVLLAIFKNDLHATFAKCLKHLGAIAIHQAQLLFLGTNDVSQCQILAEGLAS